MIDKKYVWLIVSIVTINNNIYSMKKGLKPPLILATQVKHHQLRTDIMTGLLYKDPVLIKQTLNKNSDNNIGINNCTAQNPLTTPLIYGVNVSDISSVKTLLQYPTVNPNTYIPCPYDNSLLISALQKAAIKNDPEMITLLAHHGTNMRRLGISALRTAIETGAIASVITLLELGASANLRDNNKLTPLAYAAMNRYKTDPAIMVKAIELLVQYNANPTTLVPDPDTKESVSIVQLAQSHKIAKALTDIIKHSKITN